VDDILEVGIGGHFLARKSTRQMYRAGAIWQPALWHRASFEHYVGTPLVKDAWDRAHKLIESNDVPPLPDDVRRHVSELIAGYLRGRE
jgi:trimethylamine:corrinoid methyltransferase-like protein